MAQWLQMTLAQRFGIAANIEFPLPASFIWDMFVRVLKDIPGESAFSKQSMSWKLMTLLPQRLNDESFTLLRHYLHDDSDKRKLFQLAARVADLYDQYLVYRPEWLMRWEADQRVDGLGDAQEWQAPLWKALVEYTAELGQPLWHRANLYQRFISALEAAEQPPPGYRRGCLSAGFRRCRRYTCRRSRRWVSMSMYMFSSLTRAATTGATLKIRHFWQSCSPASAATTAKRRESCPCFAIRNRLRVIQRCRGTGCRQSAAGLLGQAGARLYLPAGGS
ncbi:exodeoxyribonuclease V subunit gamma [Klebsiella michiganensis]|uniref:Exodeoxyribonuclease V subunit gamma n=1 Tax=Klebsiella michiganensis TaxID=1134687 RepID=A0A7H4M6W2_9ENTR|nr:exodeoxyribonuclease V subunit gamma [Klebsiella michiganensis]